MATEVMLTWWIGSDDDITISLAVMDVTTCLGQVVGVLLWNVFNRMSIARRWERSRDRSRERSRDSR